MTAESDLFMLSEISRIEGIAGSPSYMSPEQIQSIELTNRSDLYSLGAVMYELLTGFKPFAGKTTQQTLDRLLTAEPTLPRELNPAVPRELNRICLKLLSKFASDPDFGVIGTPFIEDHDQQGKHTYAHQFAQLEHVSGACQLFRRRCFESVGGYVPIKGGAIDSGF